MRKNFFAIFSGFKGREFESREFELLPPKVGDFYFANNSANVPNFVYNLLVSKFIHLINKKPNYRNCGRLDLAPDRELQYSVSEIKAILQLYFNREDADCSVLYITGHGTPKGEVILWTPEGDVAIDFVSIAQIWDNRTSKIRNKELLIIVDACFSGNWVFANKSLDIFVQSSCGASKARDIRFGDNVVGSVFLHNFLMANGQTDCFFEGANQKPECSNLPPDQISRVRDVFELDIMKKNWDEFKLGFKDKVRSFGREGIIWEGPPKEILENDGKRSLTGSIIREEGVKRSGLPGGPFGGPPPGGPMERQFGGPPGGPIGGHFGGPIGGPFREPLGGPMGGPPLGGSLGGPMGGPMGGPLGGPMGGPMGGPIGGFGGPGSGLGGGFQSGGGGGGSYSYTTTSSSIRR